MQVFAAWVFASCLLVPALAQADNYGDCAGDGCEEKTSFDFLQVAQQVLAPSDARSEKQVDNSPTMLHAGGCELSTTSPATGGYLGASWNNGGKTFEECKALADSDGATYLMYLTSGGSRQGGCSWYDSSATNCENPNAICRNNGQDTTNEYGCQLWKLTTTEEATTTPPADGNVLNDPHVTNLARERFDINQPATYVMLRMPMEPQKTAKFEMRALMQADGSKPCGLYMKAVMLNGSWFGDAVVQVRPLKRDREGSNGAGSKTEWPFSVQTSPEGPWKSFAELQGEGGVVALTDMVKITAEQKADLGDLLEAQTVSVSIGKKGKPASIVVSQAQHQALNMELVNMQALGNGAIGGLLGTEKHSKGVEELTEACKEFKAAEKADAATLRREQSTSDASRLSASWA